MNSNPKNTKRVAAATAVGAVPLSEPIRLTKWTATRPVTKRLQLGPNGTVDKDSTAAHLYEGEISRVACDPAEFRKLIANMGANECLSYGVPIDEAATEVMSQRKFAAQGKPPYAMTRTIRAMAWSPGPRS